MKPNQKRLLGKVLAPLVLSGIAWSLTARSPAQAQNTGLAAPPKIEEAAPGLDGDRPMNDERGPQGGGPRGRRPRGDNERGPGKADPKDRHGASDDMDKEAGPPRRGSRADGRGPRDNDRDEEAGPPRRGPHADGRGPRDDDGDEEAGPPRRGQRDDERGPGRGGPRDGGSRVERGTRGGGPEDRFGPPPPRGPRDNGPDDEVGPPRGRREARRPDEDGPGGDRVPRGHRGEAGLAGGPRDGGPRGFGPDDRGPGGRGPGGPDGEIGRARHSISDVDVFDKLTGDAYNISGQAREYYRRALNAQKAGDTAGADKNARISDELARAAVHLAEAQTGTKLPELLGGGGPRRERSKADAARQKEHASHVLNDAYRTLGETKGQWNDTARRLYSQASNSFKAGQYDQALGQAEAALHLAKAGEGIA